MFSASCMLCAASQGNAAGLCPDCLDDLPWQTKSCCPQCGLASPLGQLCGHCLQSPPVFDATRALFRYEFPLNAMLQRFKYANSLVLAESFGKLMAEFVRDGALPDLIIPMPLHPLRLRERGFNQALEIARVAAKELKLPIDFQSCRRTKLTPPQASLPLTARVKHMKDAFNCESNLNGRRIALIDDVMTTGASLNALARTVKRAGAAHVQCWVVARTLPR